MRAWLRMWWSAVRDSLWFLPSVFTAAAAALAVVLMAAERDGLLAAAQSQWWVYQGGAEGARNVVNTITGSLITVTGVVFSVTIVAVQLASSQYTPRVLRNFSSDRGNQVVLGIFIGTFTFGLLVLRTVRSAGGGSPEFVPRLSVTVAVALTLVSVGALIYYVHHVAREIQVTAILERITRETIRNVHRLFPEQLGHADPSPPPDPRRPEHASVAVRARRGGYLQAVDEDRLFALGERRRIVIGMERKIGDHVLQGGAIASVWADAGVDRELEEYILRAFVLGPERTPEQDVEFGMIQISDVAIKALSPSINDPTTAVRCIDRLAEILTEFGTRSPPAPRRTREGEVRFVTSVTTFDDAVKIAYDDIRHFGASIPLIAGRLLDVLGSVLARVPESRREPLIDQARAVLHTARDEIRTPRDRASVEKAAKRVSEAAGVDLRALLPGDDGEAG